MRLYESRAHATTSHRDGRPLSFLSDSAGFDSVYRSTNRYQCQGHIHHAFQWFGGYLRIDFPDDARLMMLAALVGQGSFV